MQQAYSTAAGDLMGRAITQHHTIATINYLTCSQPGAAAAAGEEGQTCHVHAANLSCIAQFPTTAAADVLSSQNTCIVSYCKTNIDATQ